MADQEARPIVKRRRAGHTNSHLGCLTCKERRVKCDEGKPVCRRCQTAQRECKPDPRQIRRSCKSKGLALPLSQPLPTCEAGDYVQSSLQHFSTVVLPAFNRCEPSHLWQYMAQEVDSSSTIRSMAIALGHEHRMLNDPGMADQAQTSTLYAQAVQSLRQTIASADTEPAPDKMFTVVFHCLLIVVLQCFRKSFQELNIHLQHGLRLSSQLIHDSAASTLSVPLLESHRLLKQYSIAVALFNPLLPQDAISSGIVATTANRALSDPDDLKATPSLSEMSTDDQVLREEEQNLLLDIISTTVTGRKPHLPEHHGSGLKFYMPLENNTALSSTVATLRARHATLELALQKHLRTRSTNRAQHMALAEARCMLIGVYLRCRWSGYACNFDFEHDTIKKIVHRIGTVIRRAVEEAGPTFSIGLGAVAPLHYCAMICRQPETRRRALDLLSNCPQQDGPWNAKLAADIGRTIMEYEERLAGEDGPGFTLTGYIPEHCRVMHYYYYASGEGPTLAEHLRVFRKSVGSTGDFTHEDLDLHTTTAVEA